MIALYVIILTVMATSTPTSPMNNHNEQYEKLIHACATNNHAAVKALLDSGVDPNDTYFQKGLMALKPNYITMTANPLLIACLHDNEKLINLLFAAGANPNAPIFINMTCFLEKDQTIPMREHWSHHRITKKELMLNLNVPHNLYSCHNTSILVVTCLMLHASLDDSSAPRLLLQRGANPSVNYANIFGCLTIAAARHNPDIVKLLLQYGADPITDGVPGLPSFIRHPIFNAIRGGDTFWDVRSLEYLLEAGADPYQYSETYWEGKEEKHYRYTLDDVKKTFEDCRFAQGRCTSNGES